MNFFSETRRRHWALAFIVALALCLRAYHLTGPILDHDEAHWLYYALDKHALVVKVANSLPRPDVLFPLLLTVPLRLLGPNELGMRILPVLFGAFSVLPLAWWVKRETGSETAALTAALLLAVQPLHVCLSSLGQPDSLSLFFLLSALVFLGRIRDAFPVGPRCCAAEDAAHRVPTASHRSDCVAFVVCLALALLAKGTALYFLAALALMGPNLLSRTSDRRGIYISLVVAAVPLGFTTLLIKWNGGTLTFLNETSFSLKNSMANFAWLLVLLGTTYEALLVASAWGVARLGQSVYRGNREGSQCQSGRLIWLVPLVIVLAAAPFRAFARDLIFLAPTICLFAAVILDPTTVARRFLTGVLTTILLARTVSGIWLPGELSASAGLPLHMGIAARPSGWPSRETARWLLSHTEPADAVLVTTFSYPDPLQIQLRAQRRLGVAWNHWDWLRDPAQRVKFVVFVGDVGTRTSYFARYAETHFKRVATEVVGYTIYDCQRDGRFVAYPDALSSANVYVRRGLPLLQQKQYEAAIAAFETALQVDPDSTAALHNLMVAYVECGRREEAVEIGREIVRREPNDPFANTNLAILYRELGRMDDGLEQCQKNIRLGIEPAVSYGVLGQLLEKKGDLPAARDAYAQSLSIDPTNAVTIRLYQNVETRLREQSTR